MNRIIPAIAILLVLVASAGAQDMSSFYQITGFRLPALRTGQYLVSLTPRYTSSPYNWSESSASSAPSSSTSYIENTGSYFSLSTAALYGISDKTTVSLVIAGSPGQTYADMISSFQSTSNTVFSSVNTGTSQFDNFSSSLVLAHRLQPNLEFSVLGSYTVTNDRLSSSGYSTSSGTATSPSGTSLSSSKNKYIYFEANIVLLGN